MIRLLALTASLAMVDLAAADDPIRTDAFPEAFRAEADLAEAAKKIADLRRAILAEERKRGEVAYVMVDNDRMVPYVTWLAELEKQAAANQRDAVAAQVATLGDKLEVRFLPQPRPTLDDKGKLVGCDPGYSLLLPLIGISNREPTQRDPNQRADLRVTKPVRSGVGGGYYIPLTCSLARSVNLNLFAFSEGLDEDDVLQFGGGAGISLMIFDKMQFGVGVGFDLLRIETLERGGVRRRYSNGLFSRSFWNYDNYAEDHTIDAVGRNFTLLFTFSIATDPEQPEETAAETPTR